MVTDHDPEHNTDMLSLVCACVIAEYLDLFYVGRLSTSKGHNLVLPSLLVQITDNKQTQTHHHYKADFHC